MLLAILLALWGVAAHAQVPTLVDFATVSMSAPGMPRTVADTVCVTDGRDLTCDRGVYVTPAGRVGIGIPSPIAPLHVHNAAGGLDQLAIGSSATSHTMGFNIDGNAFGRIYAHGGLGLMVGGQELLRISDVDNPITIVHSPIKISSSDALCDADRTGAIRFTGGDFSFCRNGSVWESLTSLSGGGGASTFVSLTDVSYSAIGRNVFGPGSISGAVAGVLDIAAFGHGALAANTTGYANSAVGSRALAVNTTGIQNTATGAYSLYANTSGAQNTAYGYYALGGNTFGGYNTAVGFQALISNTFGFSNVGVGAWALSMNQSGQQNVALGNLSLYNINGNNNTAAGVNTQYAMTNGNNNTSAGFEALRNFLKGSNNLVAGAYAGYGTLNATISNSTLLGSRAGYALAGSTDNTFVGYNAGVGVTTGSSNTVIGAGASPFSNTGNFQLSIANAIWGDVGSRSGHANKIGINVSSPTAHLEVSGTISATALVVNGVPITGGGGGASSDRITSGTSAVVVNSATGIVSISQFGAVASYVHPSLGYVGPGVSATGTVSASKVATNDVKVSDIGGDCTTADDYGRMFRNPTTGRLQLCMPRY